MDAHPPAQPRPDEPQTMWILPQTERLIIDTSIERRIEVCGKDRRGRPFSRLLQVNHKGRISLV